eukprot:TRINITY_DN204_c1_g3_i1.p1 TRINITY_DN204_c1_g3~~TRINITY_DN204_c1_g3_i1.p1  ORF type:complete len:513 (+),score=77.22 TRINITY_DN204_c1_g3_i1:58-1596(+)
MGSDRAFLQRQKLAQQLQEKKEQQMRQEASEAEKKEKEVPPIMTGLTNLGNTCFFNSVLQVMASTKPLINYLTDDEGSKDRVQGDLSVALCVFLRTLEKHKGTVFTPDTLWKSVCRKHQPFSSYAQQDAQELLRFFLDGLETEYAKARNEKQTSSGKKKKSKPNVITKSFRGVLDSVIKCRSCKNRVTRHEPFFDLSVEMPGFGNPEYRMRELQSLLANEPKVLPESLNDNSFPPASPSSPTYNYPEGATKKEKQQIKQLVVYTRQETDVRARIEKEEAKAYKTLMSQRPIHKDESVVACDSKGIQEYVNKFNGANIVRCLGSFFSPEAMEDKGNLYKCASCNSHQECDKQYSISTTPTVLTIHAKRFLQTGYGTQKNSVYLSFPLDLSLDPFINQNIATTSEDSPIYTDSYFNKWPENEIDTVRATANGLNSKEALRDTAGHVYRLFGVVVHTGSQTSLSYGHYTSYVRPLDRVTKVRSDTWFHTSDSFVREVSVFQVLGSEAYLLFYEKV